MQQILHVVYILHNNRLIQSVFCLIGGHNLRITQCSLAQIGGYRIAGNQFCQYKNQRRHTEQHNHKVYKSFSYNFSRSIRHLSLFRFSFPTADCASLICRQTSDEQIFPSVNCCLRHKKCPEPADSRQHLLPSCLKSTGRRSDFRTLWRNHQKMMDYLIVICVRSSEYGSEAATPSSLVLYAICAGA